MPLRKMAAEQAYRFSISPQDASLTEARIRRLLAQATADAERQARKDSNRFTAKCELEGGFLGLGEAAAILVLAAKSATGAKVIAAAAAGGVVVAKGALGGVGAVGGKLFFEAYLAPRLRQMNLLPSKFQATGKATTPAAKKKSGKKKSGRRKRG